jgi:hypothetical protein
LAAVECAAAGKEEVEMVHPLQQNDRQQGFKHVVGAGTELRTAYLREHLEEKMGEGSPEEGTIDMALLRRPEREESVLPARQGIHSNINTRYRLSYSARADGDCEAYLG